MLGDKKNKIIIGVDEAGRGPLAGPVSVAAFAAPTSSRAKLVKILGGKIRDSKQFSPARRTVINRNIWRLRKNGEVNFTVSHISNKVIDKKGISHAVKLGIKRCLTKLDHKNRGNKGPPCITCITRGTLVRMDGLLKAPREYKNQKTIIKGDKKNVFIACASIVAKVARDRLMRRLAKKFPAYSFDLHKGYGTLLHRRLIKKHGLSSLHRISFCGNL